MTALVEATKRFVARYHTQTGLVAEQRGWNCMIVLVAADSEQRVTVRLEDGRVAEVHDGEAPADLVVCADQQTLEDVLELRRGPNEPYLFGELTVRGEEAHFVRLDYITESLCPR